MLLRDYGLDQKDGSIREINKRKCLTEDELWIHLRSKGVPKDQIDGVIEDLKKEANQVPSEANLSEMKIQITKKLNPFKNLILVTNILNRSDVVYYRHGNNTELVCALEVFDSIALKAVLRKYEPDFLDNLHRTMAPLLNGKDWTLVSDIQVLNTCFNVGVFNTSVSKLTVTADIHPSVLETCNTMSMTKIPFEQMDTVGFQDLDVKLQDFLLRTEYHEYLCAILYSHFMGNLLPYVIYLHGSGGDGKTSFINMLGRVARSYATFDSSERFNYFNMYGKSIIGLAENESSKLMQNRVLKSISGGNYVQIEGKSKNSFSGQVRGLIVIDSNHDLQLLGREDEKRRLRYFRITPLVKGGEYIPLAQDHFVGQMSSKNNEFLNYCQACFNKLEIPGSYGLIQDMPNQEQTFQDLVDHVEVHKYRIFYDQHIAGRYVKGGKCDSLDLLIEVEKKFTRDPFAVRNFKKYMEVYHGIKTSGKFFMGITKQDMELENAMPA